MHSYMSVVVYLGHGYFFPCNKEEKRIEEVMKSQIMKKEEEVENLDE